MEITEISLDSDFKENDLINLGNDFKNIIQEKNEELMSIKKDLVMLYGFIRRSHEESEGICAYLEESRTIIYDMMCNYIFKKEIIENIDNEE